MRRILALLRGVLVPCFLVFAAARGAEGSVAGDILSLTGNARTKFVWTRYTPETIMLFDTNVGIEQTVMVGPFGWPQVFITPTGTRIIFMKNTTSLYVVDTSGANERELCAAKSALGVAEDPPGTEWAYYGDAYHDANPTGRLWRVQIDNTSVKQLVWDKTNICWQWAFTRDGRTAAAALPWPGCHIADLPNGSYYYVHDSGCMVGLAPSATRMLHCTATQFGGTHRGISVHVIPGGSDTEINLSATAPGCWEKTMQHPNWAMYDDRFFVVSGPDTGATGAMNVLFGQFNAAFNGIANWVQVTQNPAGKQDVYSKCWIQSGSAPANVTIDAFTASPSAILPGGSSTLSWSTTNATSVSIDQGVGGVALDGSTTVTPSSTTTYTLTAQGPGGPKTQQVTVSVSGPVLTTIVVSPSSVTIQAGGSTTFSAETFDQFGAPISGTVAWSVSGGGSLSPTTGSSTTFTSSGPGGAFTVTASSGSVQGSATVTVATITILEPAAGDVWYVGTTRRIKWTAAGVDNFMVLYSQDGGAYYSISDGTVAYNVSWTVPDSPSTQTTIVVRDYFGVLATSSVIFEIRSVTDSDDDGMDDGWELDHFGTLDRDGTGDFDGDWYSDLDEFMGGTDPTDPADMPGPPLGEGGGGLLSCGGLPVGRHGGASPATATPATACLALLMAALAAAHRARARRASS